MEAKPLTPASTIASKSNKNGAHFHVDEAAPMFRSKDLLHRRRKCMLQLCGCCTAFILILGVISIVLAFTIFRVKDPKIKMNGIEVSQIRFMNGTRVPDPSVNIKIVADVSVKNPNVASYRYGNSTTELYYHGNLVGEGLRPAGQAKARTTQRMNVTMEVVTQRILSDPGLMSDFGSGNLTMVSYTRLSGRVKIMGLVKRRLVVELNCSMTINVTSMSLQGQDCGSKVTVL